MSTWRLIESGVKALATHHCPSTSCTTPSTTTRPRRLKTPARRRSKLRRSFQTRGSRRRRTRVRGITPRRSSSDCSVSSRGWTSSVRQTNTARRHRDSRSLLVSTSTPSSSSESTDLWSVSVGWVIHLTGEIVSKMTYNVSSGTLNPTMPYHQYQHRTYEVESEREVEDYCWWSAKMTCITPTCATVYGKWVNKRKSIHKKKEIGNAVCYCIVNY